MLISLNIHRNFTRSLHFIGEKTEGQRGHVRKVAQLAVVELNTK